MVPPVPAVPAGAVVPAGVGVVPVGVGDDVAPVDDGVVGSVDGVPVAVGVEAGLVVTGVLAGSAGSIRLGGLPGPYRVLQWSGSRVSVRLSGWLLTPARERWWPVRDEEAVGVNGFAAELAETVLLGELVTCAEEVWLKLELDAGEAAAVLASGCPARDGARTAA